MMRRIDWKLRHVWRVVSDTGAPWRWLNRCERCGLVVDVTFLTTRQSVTPEMRLCPKAPWWWRVVGRLV